MRRRTAEVLALIHDDGHVAQTARPGPDGVELALTAIFLNEVGVPGWRAVMLTDREAEARQAGHRQCGACAVNLPCGCAVSQAGRGMCPHGGYDLIQDALDRMTR